MPDRQRKLQKMRIRHIKGVEELIASEPLVIDKPEQYKDNWRREVFGNENPLYLEIGMGMGTFIRTHSFNNPDINYIGLELNTTVLYKAVTRYKALQELKRAELTAEVGATASTDAGADAATAGSAAAAYASDETDDKTGSGAVGTGTDTVAAANTAIVNADAASHSAYNNLRFIRNNARFLEEYFGEDEIDKIYLNFSDPWPKERSAGRRLTSPQFLKLYEKVLKADGSIEFKTDNRGLFDYSVETIPANGWRITDITYDLHHDEEMNKGNIMTEYEEKFSSKGNPIYKLIAVRD